MSKTIITKTEQRAQAARDVWIGYFKSQRRAAIERYASAVTGGAFICRAIRSDARNRALHFGRMARKMEGRV